MKLLKYRRILLPLIALALHGSMFVVATRNPPPSHNNDIQTINYPLMLYGHGTLGGVALLIADILLVWWFIELVRMIGSKRTRILMSLMFIGVGVFLCFYTFDQSLDDYSSGMEHISSLKIDNHVYQLAKATVGGLHEVSVPVFWIIYQCDAAGTYCQPIYETDLFFDTGGDLDTKFSMRFNRDTHQLIAQERVDSNVPVANYVTDHVIPIAPVSKS